MILEFAGLPGSGKSTLNGLLIAEIGRQGLRVYGRKDLERALITNKFRHFRARPAGLFLFSINLWWQYLAFSITEGTVLNAIRPYKCSPGYWLLKDLAICSFLRTERHNSYLTRDKCLYCPDEGIVQHTTTMKIWEKHGNRLAGRWRECCDAKQMIIVCPRVPVQTAFQRLWRRGIPKSWPSNCRRQNEVMEFLLDYEKALDDTIEEFKISGARAIDIDVTCDSQELEKLIPPLFDEVMAALQRFSNNRNDLTTGELRR